MLVDHFDRSRNQLTLKNAQLEQKSTQRRKRFSLQGRKGGNRHLICLAKGPKLEHGWPGPLCSFSVGDDLAEPRNNRNTALNDWKGINSSFSLIAEKHWDGSVT